MFNTTIILATIVCVTIFAICLTALAAMRVFVRSKYEIADREIKHEEVRDLNRNDFDKARFALINAICQQYLPIFEQAMRGFVHAAAKVEELAPLLLVFKSEDGNFWAVIEESPDLGRSRIEHEHPEYAGKILFISAQAAESGAMEGFIRGSREGQGANAAEDS
jgi:hypothetical protein